MDIKKAISAVVVVEFESAAASFNINPTADAWVRLTDAMWARQAVSDMRTFESQIARLATMGIGGWIKALREAHEGKAK